MLKAFKGGYKEVNKTLMVDAFSKTPSLILDCGNAADVHLLFPFVKEEQLHDVYVINLEAIYRFRKGLEESPYWIKKLGIRKLIVTTIAALFSYDDKVENYNVLEHCWEMMKDISKEIDVFVGIGDDKMHEEFAKRFAGEMIAIA